MELRELRARSHDLEPVVRIGKNGITDNILKEIDLQLKKKKLIKVRLLRSFLETGNKKKALEEIVEKTGSEKAVLVGFSIMLYRQRSPEKKAAGPQSARSAETSDPSGLSEISEPSEVTDTSEPSELSDISHSPK